jgi:hypothetical protein
MASVPSRLRQRVKRRWLSSMPRCPTMPIPMSFKSSAVRFGVSYVREGHPEQRPGITSSQPDSLREIHKHAVTHVLRYEPAKALHTFSDALLISGNHFPQVLRVHACGANLTAPSVMLSPLRRAFGRRLLQRQKPRPTSGRARPRRRSCRASSTTCMSGSGGSPPASPPRSPDGRAA